MIRLVQTLIKYVMRCSKCDSETVKLIDTIINKHFITKRSSKLNEFYLIERIMLKILFILTVKIKLKTVFSFLN